MRCQTIDIECVTIHRNQLGGNINNLAHQTLTLNLTRAPSQVRTLHTERFCAVDRSYLFIVQQQKDCRVRITVDRRIQLRLFLDDSPFPLTSYIVNAVKHSFSGIPYITTDPRTACLYVVILGEVESPNSCKYKNQIFLIRAVLRRSEWRGPCLRLSAWAAALKKRRSGDEPLATLCSI